VSFLKNLESRLERLFEGSFKSAFKSAVQPVELANKLAKEMDEGRTVSVSRTYAPNEFTVFLSSQDREHFAGYEEGLCHELSLHLLEHARKRGYSLPSRPTVEFDTHDDLELGQFGIQARLAGAPEEIESRPPVSGRTMVYEAPELPDQPAAPLTQAVLESGDRRYALTGTVMVVGRGSGADITLDDPNVSRAHAEFRCEEGAWFVADLGSTNGTAVDGRPADRPLRLGNGSRIELGSTTLRFVLE
jgi:hypothetical protein